MNEFLRGRRFRTTRDLFMILACVALPAFAADRLPDTASRFVDLIFLPIMWRVLFGEDPAALRAEVGPHIERAVAFFLAACRSGGAADPLRR